MGGVAAWQRLLFGLAARKGSLALFDQAIVSGTSFLTTVLVGRMCGASGLGVFSLGLTVVVLLIGVQRSLISTPYTIYGNRIDGRSRLVYAGSALLHYVFLSALSAACLVLSAVIVSAGFGPAGLAPVLWVLAGITPFLLLREFSRQLSFAHLNVATAVRLDGLVAVLQMAGLVVLSTTGGLTAATAFAVMGLACAVGSLVWFFGARKNFVLERRQVFQQLKQNLLFGRWVCAEQITGLMTFQSIPWMLALMLGTKATGEFAACMAVIQLSSPFRVAVGNILGPKAARAFNKAGGEGVRLVVWKNALVLFVAMTLFCGVVALFGNELVGLIYGSSFGGQQRAIAVLALGVLAGSVGMAACHGLWAVDRPAANVKASLVGLVVAMLVAIPLVQSWGVLGAACGFLAGDVSASLVRFLAFSRIVGGAPWRGGSQ